MFAGTSCRLLAPLKNEDSITPTDLRGEPTRPRNTTTESLCAETPMLSLSCCKYSASDRDARAREKPGKSSRSMPPDMLGTGHVKASRGTRFDPSGETSVPGGLELHQLPLTICKFPAWQGLQARMEENSERSGRCGIMDIGMGIVTSASIDAPHTGRAN